MLETRPWHEVSYRNLETTLRMVAGLVAAFSGFWHLRALAGGQLLRPDVGAVDAVDQCGLRCVRPPI